jgi:tripartite-type tricarboxylate transporter receptor subunit TctC
MKGIGIFAIVVAIASFDSAVQAQETGGFYNGKSINMYIGYGPGGTYDLSARLLSKYMPRYILGHPNMIPRNRPGAGGFALAAELYNTLPQDGTALGTFARNAPQDEVLGRVKVNFKSADFHWIGTPSSDRGVCAVWHNAGISTTQEFLTKPIVVGAIPQSGTDMYPTMLNKILGTKLKIVAGYQGSNDISLAIERGEVQGRCGWSWSTVSTEGNWLKDRKIIITLQLAATKIPELPDIPLATEFAKSELDRRIIEYIVSVDLIGRPVVAPPGVPTDRVQILRQAFDATMKDADFVADATKIQMTIDPKSGAELQKIVQGLFTAPPEVIEGAKRAVERDAK